MIDLSNTITAAQLRDELGVSISTAINLLKETGSGQKVGNTTLYSRSAAEAAIEDKYRKVLDFLGFTADSGAPDESGIYLGE